MAGVIEAVIVFVLSNFPLTALVLGFIVAIIAAARAKESATGALVVEKLLSWYVFFSIGLSFLYNSVIHVFFGRMAASFIGWAVSPFQFEVGVASLGFAVVGFLAAWRGFELRLAAVVGPAIFLLGAAVGHVHQMIAAHNYAPGNAGIIFYMDIVVPLVGFLLLWLDRRAAPRPSRG
ncbi:MAG TPA: DUF6790 family protein [Acetobacteraceae bacterium]|nr:DUF6790 family protein [Acetobacteraceae bacterium]